MHTVNDAFRQLPPGSITSSDMSWNRTGSWRYLRPRLVQKISPCSEACPAGNDIEGFVYLAGQGRYEEALARILEESPFPGVCGRVCYHPCEASCNRRDFDGAVSVQGIERFLSDFPSPSPISADHVRDERVAVIGYGPAGLTCAYHLARLGYRVTVFEKENALGGMLRLGIPAYRLPRAVLDKEIQRVLALGVEVNTGCRVGRDLSWQDVLSWDAVFLAMGAHNVAPLGITGEESEGVIAGTSFLKALNQGFPISIGTRVAIIGGGNTAIDCARAALRLGARPLIVYRRTREEMPAIDSEVREALEEGIEVEWLTSPVAVHNGGGRRLVLDCIRNRLAEPDEGGRARPEPIPGTEFSLEVDAAITAVGEVAEVGNIPRDLSLQGGVIRIDSWGKTSLERVWAGGDVSTDPRMVVHAIAAGKRAALSMHAYFTGEDIASLAQRCGVGAKGSISMKRYREGETAVSRLVNEVVRPSDINLDHFEIRERVGAPHMDSARRVQGFDEVNLGYDEAAASREAGRCFHCGVCDSCGICSRFCPDMAIKLDETPLTDRFDEFYCKGCGICAEECPRSAIAMERER